MSLKSLKDKISNVAGGEILGDASAEEKKKENKQKEEKKKPEKPKKTKIKKKKKEKPEKKIETKRKSSALHKEEKHEENKVEENEIDTIEEDEEKTQNINAVRDAVEGYEDVLSILGVKETLDVDTDFTSDELDYVEFTQTQPLGFDFDEVTDFISRTKYTMHKLESALKQRERDVVKVASQVKRVEQKMVEANQAKEMERMVGGMTQEEILIEENMELKVTINELNKKINSGKGQEELIKELRKQIDLLNSENEMLKLQNAHKQNKKSPGKQGTPGKLPSPLPDITENEDTENKKEFFEDMLTEIGGMYNESLE